MESLAQAQPPRSSQDASSSEDAPVRSSSDGIRTSISSSSQLAESALSSLRKSLASQRPASPSTSQSSTTSPPQAEASPTPAPKPRLAGRSTLEDRLRAKFAIGDASNASTPSASARASPSPASAVDHPLAVSSSPPKEQSQLAKPPPDLLSPTSIPLPDSPLVSPVTDACFSLDVAQGNELSQELSPELTDPPSETVENTLLDHQASASLEPTEVAPIAEQPLSLDDTKLSEDKQSEDIYEARPLQVASPSNECQDLVAYPTNEGTSPDSDASDRLQDSQHVEAVPAEEHAHTDRKPTLGDGPTEVVSVSVSNGDATPAPTVLVRDKASMESEVPRPMTPVGKAIDGLDVDALQKRLKLVEQRFAGE